MPSKPWYQSKSIVSALIFAVTYVCSIFHVSIADLVPGLTKALGDYVNDTFALAGFVGMIVGRLRAVHALTLTKTGAQVNNAIRAKYEPFSQAPAAPSGAPASASSQPQSTETPTPPSS